MKALMLALTVGASLAIADVGLPALAKNRPLPMRDYCVTKAERKNVVRFSASDGTRLIGVEIGTGTRGVVVGHELRGSLCSWLPYARTLARRGYRVLAFDFRSSGSSGGRTLAHLDRDFVAATKVIRRHGASSVVLGGASMGGTAALAAATQISPAVDGVITLSGPKHFRDVDAVAAVGRLTIPLLFVASADDDPYDDDARELYALAPTTDKKLEILLGFRHGTALFSGGDSARSLVDDFLQTHHSSPSISGG